MGNSVRCCLACVLPCGALDLIRIVHLNGYVEEITAAVTAGEILKAYPNHVLSKPCSQGNGMVGRIMILSPDSDLKRGSIYFLIPVPDTDSKPKPNKIIKAHKSNHDHHDVVCKPNKLVDDHHQRDDSTSKYVNLIDLPHLDQAKSKPGRHQRRRSSRGKSGAWQPHLERITEDF